MLPEPCGAPAQHECVYPWVGAAGADGFEVYKGLELEVGVGDDAETCSCREIDSGTGSADHLAVFRVRITFLYPSSPSGHQARLELEAAGEMVAPETAAKGAVHRGDRGIAVCHRACAQSSGQTESRHEGYVGRYSGHAAAHGKCAHFLEALRAYDEPSSEEKFCYIVT